MPIIINSISIVRSCNSGNIVAPHAARAMTSFRPHRRTHRDGDHQSDHGVVRSARIVLVVWIEHVLEIQCYSHLAGKSNANMDTWHGRMKSKFENPSISTSGFRQYLGAKKGDKDSLHIPCYIAYESITSVKKFAQEWPTQSTSPIFSSTQRLLALPAGRQATSGYPSKSGLRYHHHHHLRRLLLRGPE